MATSKQTKIYVWEVSLSVITPELPGARQQRTNRYQGADRDEAIAVATDDMTRRAGWQVVGVISAVKAQRAPVARRVGRARAAGASPTNVYAWDVALIVIAPDRPGARQQRQVRVQGIDQHEAIDAAGLVMQRDGNQVLSVVYAVKAMRSPVARRVGRTRAVGASRFFVTNAYAAELAAAAGVPLPRAGRYIPVTLERGYRTRLGKRHGKRTAAGPIGGDKSGRYFVVLAEGEPTPLRRSRAKGATPARHAPVGKRPGVRQRRRSDAWNFYDPAFWFAELMTERVRIRMPDGGSVMIVHVPLNKQGVRPGYWLVEEIGGDIAEDKHGPFPTLREAKVFLADHGFRDRPELKLSGRAYTSTPDPSKYAVLRTDVSRRRRRST